MVVNPFVFGKTVQQDNFCNRHAEIEFLHHQFDSSTHTIIISPRRWGKSSLVEEAARRYRGSQTKFVFIDLFKCRTQEEFYASYIQAILNSTNNRIEDAFQFINKWMKSLVPYLSFQPSENTGEFKVKLTLNPNQQEDEILNLPQILSLRKKQNLVICIDEFQNIQHFPFSVDFQKKLRAYWQRHDKVHYCLYGSKRHLMEQLFESSDLPFYKFGSVLNLKKIESNEWCSFIRGKFLKTGKSVSEEIAIELCKEMQQHSYYVQQTCQILWYLSPKKTSKQNLNQALEQLSEQNELQFQKLIDGLTTYQLNFMKALVDNVTSINSKDAIKRYSLGSTATIQRSKEGLLQKDIIDSEGSSVSFVDPAFQWWFKKKYIPG